MNHQSGSLFIGFSGKAITSGRISPHPLMFVLYVKSILLTAYIGSLLLSPFKKKRYKLTRNALLDFCSSVIYLSIPVLR